MFVFSVPVNGFLLLLLMARHKRTLTCPVHLLLHPTQHTSPSSDRGGSYVISDLSLAKSLRLSVWLVFHVSQVNRTTPPKRIWVACLVLQFPHILVDHFDHGLARVTPEQTSQEQL